MKTGSALDYYTKGFTDHYADFTGRARRAAYWYFQLFHILVVLACTIPLIVATAAGTDELWTSIAMAPLVLYALGSALPSIAITVRRLHDTNRSGWWYLLTVIPIVNYIGGIVLFVFLVLEGTPATNAFGPNPKASPEDEVLQHLVAGEI